MHSGLFDRECLPRSPESQGNGRTDLAGSVSYLNHNRHSDAGAARRPECGH